MTISSTRLLVPLLFAIAAPAATAHVTLPPGGATAGSTYPAAFRVGHACKDAGATTALKVRLPAGFTPVDAPPRAGWDVVVSPSEVTWTATSQQSALPAQQTARFVVTGQLSDKPGRLWFKVLQVCDRGQVDWAEIPGRDGDKPEFPAASLDLLAPGVAPVDVREAWARVTVPGQGATGVYMKLSAAAGSRLVGGSSPLAAAVEVHEMQMQGDVMRMRVLEQGLELPTGEAVELKPGGQHLMVTGLKQALPAGSSLPVVLDFIDRDGRRGTLGIAVPVMTAPAGTPAGHKHH